MRLISQNRQVDIPYEEFVLVMISDLSTGEYLIRATSVHDTDFKINMACYSTRDRAEKMILEPSMMYQRWVAASFFKPCPEPKVYYFDKDEKDMEDKEGI